MAESRRKLRILDTTLRDGDQAAGFAFTLREKLDLARLLSACGVDCIEAGFPSSSALDAEACRQIDLELGSGRRTGEGTQLAVMCRALPAEILLAARALAHPQSALLHLSLPVSDLHLRVKLGKSRAELLTMASGAVSLACGYAGEVEMGAEDATRADRSFMAEYCHTVTAAGATIVNIADTVGYAVPEEMFALVEYLHSQVAAFRDGRAILSVHCHNDFGLAVANTLSGIRAGCGQVELSASGLGERAGNATLEGIAAVLSSRPDLYPVHTALNTKAMGELSRRLGAIIGSGLSPLQPVTGSNVRTHASGIHQSGLARDENTYRSVCTQAFDTVPERLVLSRHSGRAGVQEAVRRYAGAEPTDYAVESVLLRLKDPAFSGPTLAATDFFMILKTAGMPLPPLVTLADLPPPPSAPGRPAALQALSPVPFTIRQIQESACSTGETALSNPPRRRLYLEIEARLSVPRILAFERVAASSSEDLLFAALLDAVNTLLVLTPAP